MILPALGLLSACGVAEVPAGEAPALAVRAHGLAGVPQDGYPNHVERVVLYLTNRARTEPSRFNELGAYAPRPPLRYDKKLSEAARFHARHIIEASCWCEDHSSCCALEGQGDDVACASAPGACGGEDAGTRVRRWTSSYSGENMARGYPTPEAAMDGWIGSPGHWQNINASHSLLGVGDFQARSWVQDFGSGGTPPIAEDGVHFGQGNTTRFGITYYQPGTGGPRAIMAIIDGECHDLSLASGTPEHGAFEIARSLGAGCHRYYFFIETGDGEQLTYPEVGSLGVGVGAGEACPIYDENRPADTCSPAGQTCTTGDTRACYTGPFGTRDVGVCAAGVERCIGGAWQGQCRLEVLPGDAEVCDNGLDDNCDGQVDEGCQPDAPDMGAGADMGAQPDPSSGGDEGGDGGGCAHTPGGAPAPLMMAGLAALGLCARRRRRD